MNKISVKLTYKASGLSWIDSIDLETLQKEIKENYISNISPNGGPQAGGIVDTIVEILIDISFVDFFKIIRDGLIFDTVTRGKESFILKPLFSSFAKIESKNESWDYTKVRFLFDGTEVVVYGMSNLFTSKLGTVFNALSKHYNNLRTPYQILIPITKDSDEEGNEFYANYGGGSDFDTEDYTKFWGILYEFGYDTKIYDVENSTMLNESWKH
jgi:hypothetical protein